MKICTRCKKPWQPWKGSKLETHARCHFLPAKQDELFAEYTNGQRVTIGRLAKREGVSHAIMVATIEVARKRSIWRAHPAASANT